MMINRRYLRRRVLLPVLGVARAPLEVLARIAGTDKIGAHSYIEAYRLFLSRYRYQRINVLEIGVGGYEVADGGESLAMWEAYFRRARIVGIDVYDKTHLSHGRVRVYQCSQIDREALSRVCEDYGGFHVIIDDGSHRNDHQIGSFHILFPFLKDGGLYIVEDVQTSYWPAFGGGAVGTREHLASAIGFFTRLVDGLNHAEFLPCAGSRPLPYQDVIRAIYFEHNLIAIAKGDNRGPSNADIQANAQELARRG